MIIDDIKSSVSLKDVFVREGLEYSETKLIKCPFPDHDDSTASFKIYDGLSFYCFGCGRGGDVINFIEYYKGVDFNGALKYFEKEFGIKKKVDYKKINKKREEFNKLKKKYRERIYNLLKDKKEVVEQKREELKILINLIDLADYLDGYEYMYKEAVDGIIWAYERIKKEIKGRI